jgi:glutaredoxin
MAKKKVVKNQAITKKVVKEKPIKEKSVKKMEIPNTFTYNNYEFKKVDLKNKTVDGIKIERKVHYDKGFYTKVLKYSNVPYLFISTKKRIGFKPKVKNVKSK